LARAKLDCCIINKSYLILQRLGFILYYISITSTIVSNLIYWIDNPNHAIRNAGSISRTVEEGRFGIVYFEYKPRCLIFVSACKLHYTTKVYIHFQIEQKQAGICSRILLCLDLYSCRVYIDICILYKLQNGFGDKR
jgi:hypothetical protein